MRSPFRSFLAACCTGAALSIACPALADERAAQQIKAHTEFLADDLLEGRGTGTRGHALAARYVAAQFLRLGLQPAGDAGTFEQRLRLRESVDDLEAGQLEVHGVPNAPEFTVINDVLVRASPGSGDGAVRAPAVFVGFGVRAPELKHDDFGDVDLRGKIVVFFYGAPRHFPVNQRAYHSDNTVKAREFVRRGAVGSVMLALPRDEARYPWAFSITQARFPRMRLLDADGRVVNGFPELRAIASMNNAAAVRLFAAAGRSASDVIATAERGDPQRFPLGFELALSGRAAVRNIESMNILALLPGSNPALAAEPIVVTAHLDHIGVGPAVNGDAIYNGAMDNAIGVGVVLAIAETLAAAPLPARPVLFAALTAEEKGLLGAEHLARNPPAGIRRYAANLNIDLPFFPAPVRDLVARGGEHSTLGGVMADVAARAGFSLSPDPIPDEVVFIRSDQYPFVKLGVPALYLGSGPRAAAPGVDLNALMNAYLKERYHKPGDDLTQAIDWPSAGAFAQVAAGFTRAVAQERTAPAWLEGDFFGDTFGGDAPRARKSSSNGK